MLSITKEFRFEMAHQLEGHGGKCANIHGHSYRLLVSIQGEPSDNVNHPDCGMIMDFNALTSLVDAQVIVPFDHCLALRKDAAAARMLAGGTARIVALDYQPTCERLAEDIARRIQSVLPPHVRLIRIQLYETALSCATWEP